MASRAKLPVALAFDAINSGFSLKGLLQCLHVNLLFDREILTGLPSYFECLTTLCPVQAKSSFDFLPHFGQMAVFLLGIKKTIIEFSSLSIFCARYPLKLKKSPLSTRINKGEENKHRQNLLAANETTHSQVTVVQLRPIC